MSSQSGDAGEYEQFRRTFFEECAEILADLDASFGCLRDEGGDREVLNAIFRAVHSIKAGAGAFGYHILVQFTHNFEAALDGLRGGRIALDPYISQILVRAGDVLAGLVEAAQSDRDVNPSSFSDVSEQIDALLALDSGHAIPKPADACKADESLARTSATYRIAFRPHAEIFRHANEPLLLFRELKQLGIVHVECETGRMPKFEVLDPEEAYLAWQIMLETTESPGRIREVFEFVEDACDLTIDAANPASASKIEQRTEDDALTRSVPADIVETPTRRTGEENERTKAQAASTIRVDLARVDRLVNMVGELVITQSMLAQQISEHSFGSGSLAIQGHEDLAILTRELQECVMAIRMQPVKSVFARMPRLVRDVSAKLDKSVRLVMSGEHTEVDKTVIEELADPLTHMIRNAIDHGIERPADRLAAGKLVEGTIELKALHAGSNILIHVTDDGRGIDRDKLLKKAIEKGIVATGSSLTEEETYELLFAPGFSTADKVTDVSGRGVGMDVVRRNIVNLGGRIQVQSVLGKGTTFTLVIPLTLAVLDGMVVAVGPERYILPLTSIIESYRPDRRNIRAISGGVQVASIRGEYVRLVHLHQIFGVPDAIGEPDRGLVVLVETTQGGKIGIVVDELIGQQQVVIKSLLDNFDPVRGISGATILGNGRVALILDIEQLSQMSQHPQARQLFGAHQSEAA